LPASPIPTILHLIVEIMAGTAHDGSRLVAIFPTRRRLGTTALWDHAVLGHLEGGGTGRSPIPSCAHWGWLQRFENASDLIMGWRELITELTLVGLAAGAGAAAFFLIVF
jgi:hypothetical protein